MKQKKRVLIVINSMELGGAQKSLISFLQCLEKDGRADNYHIDIMVAKPKGIFYHQFPSFVHLVPPPQELLWLGTPRGDELLRQYPSLKGRLGKLLWIVTGKQKLLHSGLNEEQRIWMNWRGLVPENPKHYDIAVSYMNGFPGYYVIDKVTAAKKVLWIHNEYQKLNYDPVWDRPYYEAADQIITISQACVDSFVQVFPDFAGKIGILENITIPEQVLERGRQNEAPEFEEYGGIKLLSVGRLNAQKQFDLAIRTAAVLKERGLRFRWLIVGDGPDRLTLQELIDRMGLAEDFILAGMRENPYAYMARCSLFLQTSAFEGKSIVLEEARLFEKIRIVTNYPTAKDAVTDGETGLICPMEPEKLADAVLRVLSDEALRTKLISGMKMQQVGSAAELQKYLERML